MELRSGHRNTFITTFRRKHLRYCTFLIRKKSTNIIKVTQLFKTLFFFISTEETILFICLFQVQQQTRSKSTLNANKNITTSTNSGNNSNNSNKEVSSPDTKRDLKTPTSDSSVKSLKSGEKKEEKKRGRKKINPEDKASHSDR